MSGPFHPASDKLYWWDENVGGDIETEGGMRSSLAKHNVDNKNLDHLNADEQDILSRPLLDKSLASERDDYDDYSDDNSGASGGNSRNGDDNEVNPEVFQETFRTLVVSILAATGITTSIAVVAISIVTGAGLIPMVLVATAGGLTTVISPVVVKSERDMSKMASTRQAMNQIRGQIDALKGENDKLAASNTKLEGEVVKLKDFEKKLGNIVGDSGANVGKFVELVKEFRVILDAKQVVIKTIVLQDLIGLMMKQDTNNNFEMDEEEMDSLFFALETYGVEIIDKQGFKTTALKDPSIDSVLLMVKELLDKQEVDEKKVMEVQENQDKASSMNM